MNGKKTKLLRRFAQERIPAEIYSTGLFRKIKLQYNALPSRLRRDMRRHMILSMPVVNTRRRRNTIRFLD